MLLEEFNEVLKNLKTSRYSTKIALSNSYENVLDIKRVFSKNGYNLVELSDYQKDKNSWFGVSTLLEIIKNLDKRSVVFGVSEIIRFYEDRDFFLFFNSLFEVEDRSKIIFIPLFGLESRFNLFFQKFHRKDEYDYVYKIDSKSKRYELFIVDFNVPFDNQLESIKDWLNFYKNPENNLICSPKPLIFKAKNLKNDDLIQVEKITNQKEFVEKYMHKKFPIEFKEEEKEFWNRLIKDLKNSTVEEILKDRFNLNSLKAAEILKEICQESDLYYKWLMKGYALLQKEDSYFYEVVKNSKLNEALIERVWFDIFDNYDAKYILERYEILKEFYKSKKPSKSIEEKLKKLLEKSKVKIPLLTGITDIEKEYIIQYYKLGKVDKNYLREYYKDLICYLDGVDFLNSIDWIIEYFNEYKKSKVENEISKRLDEILNKKNIDKESFFNWYTDTAFKNINDFIFDENRALWIDGLGVEWVGVIKNYCIERGYGCEFYLSKSNLPSITKCNRFENIQKIDKLDSYIHSQSKYQYPKNLIEEIEIVKNILDDYLQDELIIVSDHGFSAFCSFQERVNSFDFDEHEGRCAKIDRIIDDKNYFSYDFECGRYLVSLNHTSLNNKTRREAHGGATPEEVVVPIIRIYKQIKDKQKEDIKRKSIKRKGFEEVELF